MTCNFIQGEDGLKIIFCTDNFTDDRCKLKKAMVCRRQVDCEECKSHDVCQRVLEKRKLKESE